MTSGTISRNASPISAPARYGSVRIVLADLNRMISPFENNKDRSFFVLCVLAPRSLSVGDTIPRCLNLFSAIIPNTLVANEPSEQAWGSAQVAQQVPYERGHVGAPGGVPAHRDHPPGRPRLAHRGDQEEARFVGECIRAPHSPPEGAFSFTCTPFGGVMPPVAENSFPLLSVKEAADYLGMSRDWVYERMKSLIPHDKIGGRSGSGRKTSTGTSRRRPSPRSTPRTSGLQSRFGRRCVSRDPY